MALGEVSSATIIVGLIVVLLAVFAVKRVMKKGTCGCKESCSGSCSSGACAGCGASARMVDDIDRAMKTRGCEN